jgi:hypothetical protein
MDDLQSEYSRQVVHGAWNHASEHDVSASERHQSLTDDGAIQSYAVNRLRPCHCGCLGQPGGCCSICAHVICATCLTHCPVCLRPVGPCCSRSISGPDGRPTRLCIPCHAARRRGRIWELVLSLFVWFDDER